MKTARLLYESVALVAGLASQPAWASVRCEVAASVAASGMQAQRLDDGAELHWSGEDGHKVALRVAVEGGAPKIALLTIDDVPVLRNAGLRFDLTTGVRRISGQQLAPLRELGVAIDKNVVDALKWDAFWDAPLDMRKPDSSAKREMANQPPVAGVADQPGLPRAASEVVNSTARYDVRGCSLRGEGARTVITFPGVTAGVFSGALAITAYRGTDLLRVELIATTRAASVAYKYDAAVDGLAIEPGVAVHWRDTAGVAQHSTLTGKANDGPVVLQAANRIVAADTGQGGAVAAFPPPHVYFWARELEANVGNDWYSKDAAGRLAIGIRQAEKEVREEYHANWALYSAPPGSEQHMALYLYPATGGAERARAGALRFTRGDRYLALPGYKVMAHHFHLGMGERILASGDPDLRLRDFEVLRGAGIDIASVTDVFPDQRNPGGPGRLDVMRAYFDGAARMSDSDFLILPNLESFNIMGGHTDFLLSRPTLWLEHREAGQPLKTALADGTPVYHVGTPDDVMRMVGETGMLVYMPHPRTKGSTGYPDAIKDGAAFNTDAYRGIGWRWGMGSDLSERRLSEKRVLPLFDEMNDWAAARRERPKYILAITETFEKAPGDDVYANNPVNYLRLPALPHGQDYRPIIDVLNRGDYFVTSGEVLVPEARVERAGRTARFVADLQWTFPLDMIEVVWGDGKGYHRQVIDKRELPPFGAQHFVIPFAPGKARWARLAAWDSAGNGAMTQPVALAGQ